LTQKELNLKIKAIKRRNVSRFNKKLKQYDYMEPILSEKEMKQKEEK